MDPVYTKEVPDSKQNHKLNRFVKVPTLQSDGSIQRKKPNCLLGHKCESKIKFMLEHDMVKNCPYGYEQIKNLNLFLLLVVIKK